MITTVFLISQNMFHHNLHNLLLHQNLLFHHLQCVTTNQYSFIRFVFPLFLKFLVETFFLYCAFQNMRNKYWVLYNYVRARKYFNCNQTITYTTHGDFTFLDNLEPLLERYILDSDWLVQQYSNLWLVQVAGSYLHCSLLTWIRPGGHCWHYPLLQRLHQLQVNTHLWLVDNHPY